MRKLESFPRFDEPLVTEANGSSKLNAKQRTVNNLSSHPREKYAIILFPTSPRSSTSNGRLHESHLRDLCVPGE
jgi:hypothetical protein